MPASAIREKSFSQDASPDYPPPPDFLITALSPETLSQSITTESYLFQMLSLGKKKKGKLFHLIIARHRGTHVVYAAVAATPSLYLPAPWILCHYVILTRRMQPQRVHFDRLCFIRVVVSFVLAPLPNWGLSCACFSCKNNFLFFSQK